MIISVFLYEHNGVYDNRCMHISLKAIISSERWSAVLWVCFHECVCVCVYNYYTSVVMWTPEPLQSEVQLHHVFAAFKAPLHSALPLLPQVSALER